MENANVDENPEVEKPKRTRKKKVEEAPEGKVKANVKEDHFINKGEENNVHFYVTDPQIPEDPTEPRARRVRRQIHKDQFVSMYQMNFMAGGAMQDVNTALKVFACAKNITSDIVKEAFTARIESATKKSTAQGKAKYIGGLLKSKKRLHLNGTGLSFISPDDLIHVPLEDGEDLKDLDKFPSGVMFDANDYAG